MAELFPDCARASSFERSEAIQPMILEFTAAGRDCHRMREQLRESASNLMEFSR
jgi:hypothetical protein